MRPLYSLSQKNFPCKAFRQKLRKNYDKNKDGKLSKAEIKKVKVLDVDATKEKNISLKGAEYLTNLRSLDLRAQKIKTLDLRKNLKLKSLEVTAKKVKTLKVSEKNLCNVYLAVDSMSGKLDFRNFKKLDRIEMEGGSYNKLDVSGSSVRLIKAPYYSVAVKKILAANCKKLSSLDLNATGLQKIELKGTNGLRVLNLSSSGTYQKLDVSRMKNLRELSVAGSKLASLSVNNNKKLEILDISDTNISGMNLSNNSKLRILNYRNAQVSKMLSVPNPGKIEELDCSSTKITALDLSEYVALKKLNASETKIASLDMRNCRQLTSISVRGNKKLLKLDLSNQTKLEDVKFGNSALKELDISGSLSICDRDDLGAGLDFVMMNHTPCKIIVNKNWGQLKYYQNLAKNCNLNITWQLV